jgi:hypothetical protein
MNLLKSAIVFSVLYASHVSAQLPAPEAWETADERTIRIDPDKIEGLPAEIMADLLFRGCTIPQWYRADETKGIIKGSFFSPDSSDLAVLCSIDRVSTILVYRDSSTSEIHEINQAPDERYIQSIGEGKYGFPG